MSVKVEPRSISRLSSALFILPLFHLRDYNLSALTYVAKNASVEININFAYPVKWAKRNDETTRRVKNRHRHRSDETTGRSNKVRRENGEIKRKWWTKRRNEATK